MGSLGVQVALEVSEDVVFHMKIKSITDTDQRGNDYGSQS
jgi:hypothetical protein